MSFYLDQAMWHYLPQKKSMFRHALVNLAAMGNLVSNKVTVIIVLIKLTTLKCSPL